MRRRAVAALFCGLLLSGCTGSSEPADPPAADPPAAAESRESAAHAASEQVRLLSSIEMYDRQERERILIELLHPQAQDRRATLEAGFDRVASVLGLDESGHPSSGTLVARAAVLGADVARFDPPRAEVRVWIVSLLGVAAAASAQPVQERWSTEVVDVLWDGERWRHAGLVHEEGPVPVGGAQLPSPAEQLGDAPAPLAML